MTISEVVDPCRILNYTHTNTDRPVGGPERHPGGAVCVCTILFRDTVSLRHGPQPTLRVFQANPTRRERHVPFSSSAETREERHHVIWFELWIGLDGLSPRLRSISVFHGEAERLICLGDFDKHLERSQRAMLSVLWPRAVTSSEEEREGSSKERE